MPHRDINMNTPPPHEPTLLEKFIFIVRRNINDIRYGFGRSSMNYTISPLPISIQSLVSDKKCQALEFMYKLDINTLIEYIKQYKHLIFIELKRLPVWPTQHKK